MRMAMVTMAALVAGAPVGAAVDKPAFNEVTVAVPGASEADCVRAECRPGGNQIVLRYDATHGTQFTVPRSPFLIDDGSIVIYPGEVLLFDFPEATPRSPGRPRFLRTQDGRVSSSDPAAANAAPQLTLSYRQEQVSPGQFEMELDLKQSLPAPLKFDSIVSHFTTEGIVRAKSASCVLVPNRTGIEAWPEMVGPLVLSDLRFSQGSAGNAAIACE